MGPQGQYYFWAHKEAVVTGQDEDIEIDLADALGATESTSRQQLTLYIPDKDRSGNEIGTQRSWVLDAAKLLARIGGGVTVMPPVEGGWFDAENDVVIWERPVLVYTFIRAERFIALLGELRAFLHRLGRETHQGEIIVDFAGAVMRITKFIGET
jgi:hypothetical protein